MSYRLSASRLTARSGKDSIAQVLAVHRGELLAIPGVVGVGRGERDGEPCIVVLVERAAELPSELDGYAVSVIRSGPITAI